MQQWKQSRELRITDPAQAAAFSDAFRRRLLIAFIDKPKTIGAACAEIPDIEVSTSKAFYHAMRLEKLGLIRLAGERPRRGRALKLYLSVARAFFVPRALMAVGPEAGIAAELRARLDQEAARRQDGVIFTRTEDGGPLARAVARAGSGGGRSFEAWRVLMLTQTEAREFAQDFAALLSRYGERARNPARGARACLIHGALVPRN
ncbi:MAG: hypothetical protein Tsb0010_08380 [Parvularculaceae bacterium]